MSKNIYRKYRLHVEFRDKDVILMQTIKGEYAEVRIQFPSESIMKQVTNVKVIRAK